MAEVGPTTNLYINLEHVICFPMGGFGTEGTFTYLDVCVGDAEVRGLYSMMGTIVDDFVGCDVEGLVVARDEYFGSFGGV